MAAQVRVGVGVFLFNSAGSFIIGKRKGSHGAGKWALPGGHLDFGETFEACATREVLEETGLKVKDVSLRFLTATNDIMASEHKHYVTIFMGCRLQSDDLQPKVLEPEKCETWEWVTWHNLRCWAQAQLRQRDDVAERNTLTPNSTTQPEHRQLFLPLLSLLIQQSGLDPVQSYESSL